MLTALLVASACGGEAFPPDDRFPSVDQPVALTVTDPGQAPRRVLRWRPEPGAGQRFTIVMKLQIDVDGGELGQEQTTIAVELQTNARVRPPLPDGRLQLDMITTSAAVSMPLDVLAADDLGGAFRPGATLRTTMDAQALTSEIAFVDPTADLGGPIGTLDGGLDQMMVPLPADAVGVGATWQVLGTHTANGMALQTVGTYELTGMAGDRLTVRARFRERGRAQPLPPGIFPGGSGTLRRFAAEGRGAYTIDLTRPHAVEGQVRKQIEASMDVRLTSVRTDVSFRGDVSADFTPGGPITPAHLALETPEPATAGAPAPPGADAGLREEVDRWLEAYLEEQMKDGAPE